MNTLSAPANYASIRRNNSGSEGRDHMEIARVAKRLWNQAGRPAGRYVEYWANAERAVTMARDAVNLEAVTKTDRGDFAPAMAGSSDIDDQTE